MSVIEVGVMAGEMLTVLEQHGGRLPLAQVTSSRRCSRDLAMMALGWLFKEGLVTMHAGLGDWWVKARVRDSGYVAC